MKIVFAVATLAVAAFLMPPAAQASLMASDPLAMAAWRGTQTFYAGDAFYALNVTVDYAVYEPGQFPGADLSGGTDYVYAYEIFNTLNPASVEVSKLTVGLAPGSSARYAGSADGPPGQIGGVGPVTPRIAATSASWNFSGDLVVYGQDSITLYFSRRYGPHLMTGSVMDGGLSAYAPLPSPMPEPATLALLAAGLTSTILVRRRRAIR
ncbi:MAG: PEP-CTERM sorting domain-containing protein [Planctomycetota bacterium]|nr:PEP-CTERM sorting domain-containing protein [Planctomycetota bacterium]